MEKLPKDLIRYVCGFMCQYDTSRLMRVSKTMNNNAAYICIIGESNPPATVTTIQLMEDANIFIDQIPATTIRTHIYYVNFNILHTLKLKSLSIRADFKRNLDICMLPASLTELRLKNINIKRIYGSYLKKLVLYDSYINANLQDIESLILLNSTIKLDQRLTLLHTLRITRRDSGYFDFSGMPALTDLHVTGGVNQHTINTIPGIIYLTIDSPGEFEFSGLTKIVSLNAFCGVKISSPLLHLKSLKCDNMSILKMTPNLTDLDLSYCKIINPEEWIPLKSLTLESISKLILPKRLKKLTIKDASKLTQASVPLLKGLSSLSISGNKKIRSLRELKTLTSLTSINNEEIYRAGLKGLVLKTFEYVNGPRIIKYHGEPVDVYSLFDSKR